MLRLNQPLIQAVNFLAYPLQLALILPFLQLGEKIFGGPRVAWTLPEILAIISREPVHALSILGVVTLHGVGAWALACIPLFGLLFLGARPLLHVAARRMKRAAALPGDAATPPSG